MVVGIERITDERTLQTDISLMNIHSTTINGMIAARPVANAVIIE